MALNVDTNLVTFEIEDYHSNTKMSFIFDREKGEIIRTDGCSVADLDNDYIYDTDNDLLRVQADYILNEEYPEEEEGE